MLRAVSRVAGWRRFPLMPTGLPSSKCNSREVGLSGAAIGDRLRVNMLSSGSTHGSSSALLATRASVSQQPSHVIATSSCKAGGALFAVQLSNTA